MNFNRFYLFLAILIWPTLCMAATPVKISPQMEKLCKKLDDKFRFYGWDKSQCETFEWNHYRNSVLGEPLAWTIFGDVSDEKEPSFKNKDVILIMCGVHGDEVTPIKFCFDIMYFLRDKFNDEKQKEFLKNKVVLVSPVVNPDAFLKSRPTRYNARGVDVNRNFPTRDWFRDARKFWIAKLRKDKRRNPGLNPGTEPEVVFQVNLIKRYGPDKIISVHSPLTMLDYDGPNTIVASNIDGGKAQELLQKMSKDASDYKIENYPFFPGSLGNWAGKERDIPTYTLELPTSNPKKSKDYWLLFKEAINSAVLHEIKHIDKKEADGRPESKSEIIKVDQGSTPSSSEKPNTVDPTVSNTSTNPTSAK